VQQETQCEYEEERARTSNVYLTARVHAHVPQEHFLANVVGRALHACNMPSRRVRTHVSPHMCHQNLAYHTCMCPFESRSKVSWRCTCIHLGAGHPCNQACEDEYACICACVLCTYGYTLVRVCEQAHEVLPSSSCLACQSIIAVLTLARCTCAAYASRCFCNIQCRPQRQAQVHVGISDVVHASTAHVPVARFSVQATAQQELSHGARALDHSCAHSSRHACACVRLKTSVRRARNSRALTKPNVQRCRDSRIYHLLLT
jgi:hypothetical protein